MTTGPLPPVNVVYEWQFNEQLVDLLPHPASEELKNWASPKWSKNGADYMSFGGGVGGRGEVWDLGVFCW